MLDCSRDGPEELEEHSMVAYKVIDQLYCLYPDIISYYTMKCYRLLCTEILYPENTFMSVQIWM